MAMEQNEIVSRLLRETKNHSLKWSLAAARHEYQSFDDKGLAYTVASNNGKVVLSVFDDNGMEKSSIDNDPLLQDVYDAAENSYLEVDNMSLKQVEDLLSSDRDYNLKNNGSLYVSDKNNPYYIEPYLADQVCDDHHNLRDVQVILISAPGATGKSEMTKELSFKLHLPVFDLAAHPPVGSNSLLGLLFDNMDTSELTFFLKDLNNGNASMLIDALDEAYAKTSQNAFDSFLNDVVKIALTSSGVPFVILGRTSILEYTYLYLEEKGVKSVLLQIEPFTIEQARKFIDVQIGIDKIEQNRKDYTEIRNHILDSIRDFFKGDARGQKSYESFIGYAPVLQAISTLISKEPNIHALKNDILSSSEKNVKLILEILVWILERESKKLKEPLASGFSECSQELKDSILRKAYNIDEQCARLLNLQMGDNNLKVDIAGDTSLNNKYEEIVQDFFYTHPFIDSNSRKISNVVFESFIIARLIDKEEYRDDVLLYLQSGNHVSYILFDIFKAMYGDNKQLDPDFLQYMVSSFQSTDRMGNRKEVMIEDQDKDDTQTGKEIQQCECTVTFYDDINSPTSYYFSLKAEEKLQLPSVLSNISIDAPISIELEQNKIEFIAPVNILCKDITLKTDGLVVTPSKEHKPVIIECDKFSTPQKNSNTLQYISNKGNVPFRIITQNDVNYPFTEYKDDVFVAIKKDPLLNEKYTKMRRMLLQFRSHRRGIRAKYKNKIDNRFGRKDIGKKVLDALKKVHIITEDNTMYYIDAQRMAEVLEVKYDDLRTCEINDSIIKFLTEIK